MSLSDESTIPTLDHGLGEEGSTAVEVQMSDLKDTIEAEIAVELEAQPVDNPAEVAKVVADRVEEAILAD